MYCASCQTEITESVITHFTSKHYFKPRQQNQEQESQEQVGFFNDSFNVDVKCPTCGQSSNMEIKQNLKSILITCGNDNCQQVKLYRLVIDRPTV